MKISLEGRAKLAARLRDAARDVEGNVNRAVAVAAEDLLARAIPLTPLKSGELRQSGYVDPSPGVAEVGFSAPYAPWVHELGVAVRPEAAPIDWSTPGTGAKFLQNPFNERKAVYAKSIKDAAREAIRGV